MKIWFHSDKFDICLDERRQKGEEGGRCKVDSVAGGSSIVCELRWRFCELWWRFCEIPGGFMEFDEPHKLSNIA